MRSGILAYISKVVEREVQKPLSAPQEGVRTIERQLDQERRKLQNLIAAIEAVSGAPSSLLKAIADREGAMKLEGEHRKTVDKPAGPGLPDVAGWVEKQLRELTGVLKVNPAKVKSEFGRLNLQLSFTPTEAEPRPCHIVKGRCDLSALVFFYLRSRYPGCGSGPIEGESGTGKELVARQIHELSRPRRDVRRSGLRTTDHGSRDWAILLEEAVKCVWLLPCSSSPRFRPS